MTAIFHISDIHIREGFYDDLQYAFEQLTKRMLGTRKKDIEVILVIAGDIFESKVKVSQHDMRFFHMCMMLFEKHKIPTFLIPGNHDYNINNGTLDLVTVMVKIGRYDYVKCYSETGIYEWRGGKSPIDWHVFSPIDQKIPSSYTELQEEKKAETVTQKVYKIALVHEPVQGCMMYSGIIRKTSRLHVKQLQKYDIAMLGDIHKPQFLADNVAYPGSLVQKNMGEGLAHGYIYWNLQSCKGKFHPLPALSAFITLELNGKDLGIWTPPPGSEEALLQQAQEEQEIQTEKTAAQIFEEELSIVIPEFSKQVSLETSREVSLEKEASKKTESPKKTEAPKKPEAPKKTRKPRNNKKDEDLSNQKEQDFNPEELLILPDTNAKYLRLKYQYLTEKQVSKFVKYIEDKYHRRVDVLMDATPDKTKKQPKNIKRMEDQMSMMESHLKKFSVPDNIAKQILEIHGSTFDRQISTAQKWSLNYVYWSNVFCYGEENYIDFKSLGGLVSVIGRNKTGKSSILDIIILALYNCTLRGSILDTVNNRKSYFRIICSIQANQDEYVIDRSFNRQKIPVYRLYKNGQNITKSSINETYQVLTSIIGPKEDFINITTSLQTRVSFVDHRPIDRARELMHYLNIDVLANIEKESNQKLRELKAIIKSMGEPPCDGQITRARIESIVKEQEENEGKISTIAKAIEKVSTAKDAMLKNIKPVQESEKEILVILESLKSLKQTKPLAVMQSDLQKTNERKDKITAEITKLAKTQTPIPPEIVSFLNVSETKVSETNCFRKNVTDEEIRELQDKIIPIQACRTSKTLEQLKDLEAALVKILEISNHDSIQDSIQNSIRELYGKLQRCEINAPIKIPDKPTETLDALLAKKKDLESKYKPITQSLIASYDRQLQDITSKYGSFSFNTDCTDCNHNRQSIETSTHKSEIESKIKKATEQMAKNEKIQHNIKVTEKKISIYSIIEKAVEQNKIFEQNQHIQRKIDEIKLYQDVMHDLAQIRNKDNRALLKELQDSQKYNKWSEIKKANEVVDQQIQILDQEQQKLAKEIHNMQSELALAAKNENKVELEQKLKQIHVNNKSELKIKEYITNLKSYEEKMDLGRRMQATLIAEKAMLEERVKHLQGYEEKTKETNEQIEIYDIYVKMLNPSRGIPFQMLNNFKDNLLKSANGILADITDFQLDFNFDGSKVEIYIKDNFGAVPAEMGSGFQKFVIDITLRICFSQIIKTLPQVLMIDEGFGCMDALNLRAMQTALHSLKKSYEWVLIITHLEDMQLGMDQEVKIVQIDGHSQVKQGDLPKSFSQYNIEYETILQEATVHERNSKQEFERIVKEKYEASGVKLTAKETFQIIPADKDSPKRLHCKICDKIYKSTTDLFQKKHMENKTHIKKLIKTPLKPPLKK